MKYFSKNSLMFSILLTTVTTMVTTVSVPGNMAFGQAVDLIPIQTGNATLDNALPEFYDCIDEKIDESKGVGVDPYFEKEPTKHEVATCYDEVLITNSAGQSNDDSAGQSNDDSAGQSNDDSAGQSNDDSAGQSNDDFSGDSNSLGDNDIEFFNSLFGVSG